MSSNISPLSKTVGQTRTEESPITNQYDRLYSTKDDPKQVDAQSRDILDLTTSTATVKLPPAKATKPKASAPRAVGRVETGLLNGAFTWMVNPGAASRRP